jgi:L-iditol 2-dehydrogenase
MLALHYPRYGYLEVAELPMPVPRRGEVLLRVGACGVCGSELETFQSRSVRRPPPLVMGHEFCGIVEEVGPGVEQEWRGRRVVCNAVVPCLNCVRCRRGDTHLCGERQVFGMHRSGAFAGFVSVPVHCLVDWPAGLPAAAACLAEPLANGVHVVGLVRHLDVKTALVIGSGPIGLMCQQALQAMLGVKVIITDLNPARLAVAARLGASRTVDGKTENVLDCVHELTDGEGVDVVVDAVGSGGTKRSALKCCRPGGAVVWIGLHENEMTFDSYEVTLAEKQVFGTYSARLSELEQALDLMKLGKVDVTSWVQSFPLERSVEAFERMLSGSADDVKAVIVNDE